MNVLEMLLLQGQGGRLRMNRRIWGLLIASPRVLEGQVGCSGAISIVLSYIWHFFATGWFSGWTKASVPLLMWQIQWHRHNPHLSQPLPLLSHAALIRLLLLWLTKSRFSRHIKKSGTQPLARAQILQQCLHWQPIEQKLPSSPADWCDSSN